MSRRSSEAEGQRRACPPEGGTSVNGETRPGVLGAAPRHAGPARTGRGAGTLSPRRGRQDLGPGCLNGGLRLVSLSPEKPSAPVQSLHRVLQPGLPQRSQRGPLCAQLLRQPPPVPASQRLSGVWTLPLGESSGWEMPGGASRAWGPAGVGGWEEEPVMQGEARGWGKGGEAQLGKCMGEDDLGVSVAPRA